MKHHFSRRAFLTGIGGGAASAVVIWELSEQTFRPGNFIKEDTIVASCCPYTEHEGWLVAISDKRFLSFPVRYTEGWFSVETESGNDMALVPKDRNCSGAEPRSERNFARRLRRTHRSFYGPAKNSFRQRS